MPYVAFNTYIDDADMIPILLSYDWVIWKDTWTNCKQHIYNHIKDVHLHDYKHQKKSWFPDNHLSFA
mgnify:FL=1